MKICLVSAFPPSRRLLNEYGFHLAQELRRNSSVQLTILADEMAEPATELDGYHVVRCWQLNRTFNQGGLLRAVRAIRPDVVWFNLLFSTFGNGGNPAAAFFGMTLPATVRAVGFYTHVTLHHLMDHVDLADAGIRHERLFRMAGGLATRAVLRANSVSVLLPAYRTTLVRKYGGRNVYVHPHGILSAMPEPPDFARRGHPFHRILAFGKWGTYKRVESLLAAFPLIAEAIPRARLVIAGDNHPMAPGYIESLAEKYKDDDRIEFTGYLEEEELPELFRLASAVIMPYSSATGASGVAHLACQYGVPVVCADIPDFRGMAAEENLAVEFYRNGDTADLAGKAIALLRDDERQRVMAEQNFAAAMRMTMPEIVRQYLKTFDLRRQYPRRRLADALHAFSVRLPRSVGKVSATSQVVSEPHLVSAMVDQLHTNQSTEAAELSGDSVT